jgi:nucleotide-binding universal stress UspA family protein
MESSASTAQPGEQPAEIQDEFTAHSPFTNILIYVDGSEASMEAIRVGIRIASTHRLPVIFLYVIEEKLVEEFAAISQDTHEVILRQMEVKSRRYLEYVEQLAGHYAVTCQKMVRRGIPHQQIADVARDTGIDLIVIGDSRKQGARRSISGGVVDLVIEYTHCPVLVVPCF